tara:strand:- start:86 stop:1216 length:1131 start_codon:yes stop_codon:yes gene_type:complete
MTLTYQTKKEDLEKWFKFSIEYWLNPKKGKTGRTSGQPRGLGDVLDSFMMKIIETGIAKIIEENYSENKEFITDDAIKPNNVIRDDPDIFKIKENDNERDPKVFIEIKYHSANAHWIGPRTKQIEAFETGSSRLNINDDKIYIIGADIINDSTIPADKGKKDSLLGIFLKSFTDIDYFNEFYETLPKIQIRYALRLRDLKNKGTIVGKGDYFLSTAIFEENKFENFYKDESLKEKYKIIEYPHWDKVNNEITLCLQSEAEKTENGKIKIPLKNNPIENYGKFKIIGENVDFIIKENDLSDRYFILCKEDIKLSNEFFGEYNLKNNSIYSFQLNSMGRDPTIKNENLFISENYLKKLQKNDEIDSIENVLKEIGENA